MGRSCTTRFTGRYCTDRPIPLGDNEEVQRQTVPNINVVPLQEVFPAAVCTRLILHRRRRAGGISLIDRNAVFDGATGGKYHYYKVY